MFTIPLVKSSSRIYSHQGSWFVCSWLVFPVCLFVCMYDIHLLVLLLCIPNWPLIMPIKKYFGTKLFLYVWVNWSIVFSVSHWVFVGEIWSSYWLFRKKLDIVKVWHSSRWIELTILNILQHHHFAKSSSTNMFCI